MKKRILSFFTVLSMVLILSNGLLTEISAAATQNCTGDHSGMTAWTEPDALPTSGTYYLDTDVTISQQTTINSGDNLTLCLNGHTVKATAISRIFYIKGGSLTLCDCQNNNGKLTGGCTKLSGVSADKDGGAVYLDGGSFTMYGGTISGNATAGNTTYKGAGGGVYVNRGTFTMNGGVISDNRSSKSSGGGVYVNSGTFTMNGGTISENKALDGGGGGISVDGGTFTMNSGSTISNNEAYSGGGVEVNGTFTMNGGVISQNKSQGGGGGVNAGASANGLSTARFTINDGVISDNEAAGNGGGVYTFGRVSVTMNGGTISGNSSKTGGGVYVNYPTGKGSSVNLNGNVNITGNTKTDSTSNNVHINSGSTLTIGSNFSTNTPIGVSVSTPPTSCANPVAVTNSVSEAVYEKFTSDMGGDGSFSLGFTDGIIQFEIPHDYDTAGWTSDGSSHWHKCKTTDCSAKKDEAAHTWNDGLCTICGASDPYIGDGYAFDPDTGKLTVTSNEGTTNWRDNTNIAKNKVMSVEITEQVRAIGNEAFKDCTQIEKIAIPDSVLSIGESAFSGCSALNEVTLPESLTEIKAMTFKNCSSLKSINIPAGVTSIGESAFYNSYLIRATLPKGVTSIGSHAFDECGNLFAVIYPDGASVGENAFYSNKTALLKYDAEAGGDKYRVTEIVLPDTFIDVGVKDDMNIGFVAEDQRSKVSQYNHTHIGGTATCTQKAKCDICNAEYGKIVAHTLTAHAAVSATCTTDGNNAYWTCSGCNKIFADEDGTREIDEIPVIPAGHKYGTDWKSDADSHWHECTVCNDKKDIGSHTWNSGTVTTEPTEEAEGVKTYTCTVCAAARTESVDKLEHTHTLTAHVAVSATCTTNGNNAYWTCSGCHKIFSDENGTTEIDEIPVIPAGHKYSEDWKSDANQHWHECTVCNDKKDIGSHTWNNGVVTTEPTEEAEGVKTYTCTVCAATRTESVDKLEHTHTLTAHVAVSATCTTDGNNAYWTCSGCHKIFSDENGTTEIDEIPVIPAGHKYSEDWKSDANQHWHECTVCNDKKDIGSHTWNNGVVTTEPTEEAEGVKTYTCTVCAATRTESIDKLEHTHTYSNEWTSDSTSHWHVATCGHNVISGAAAHMEDGGSVTKAPTETETGIRTYKCSVCGYVMRTETIDKLPPLHTHSYSAEWKSNADSHWHECECGEKSELVAHISSGWIVEIPATVDAEGVRIKKCTVCGIELARETIEKLPDGNKGDVVEDVKDTSGTNAGLVQDNTLIENVLTDGDKTEVENGRSFEIVLEVTDIQSSVPAGDAAAASSALRSGENIGIYVDLSLFKIKDKSERTPIYNTSGQIGITLTVPDSIYASGRTYSIIRIHDGKAENLGGTYDKTSRRLTFYTDKFSTYAIVYYENGKPGENETPSTPPSGENEAPSTGDSAYTGWLLMLILASAGVFAVAGRKHIGEKE